MFYLNRSLVVVIAIVSIGQVSRGTAMPHNRNDSALYDNHANRTAEDAVNMYGSPLKCEEIPEYVGFQVDSQMMTNTCDRMTWKLNDRYFSIIYVVKNRAIIGTSFYLTR